MHRRLSIISLTLVLAAGCTEPAPPTMSLYRAVQTGDLDQVKRHIYWETDVSQPDAEGDYPLHVAARDGRVRIARALVEDGADPGALNGADHTALRVALGHGKTQVAQMLIEHGAALDAQAMLAELVLAGISDRDSFELLLRRGVDLSRRDPTGRTLLHLAIDAGHLSTVARLVELGADVSAPDATGQTPLALAVQRAEGGAGDRRGIVELLERNGAALGRGAATSSPERQGKPQ